MKKGSCLVCAVSVAVLFLSSCGTPNARRNAEATSLRFVVLGDNQPYGTETLGQPEVFKQIVKEIAAQKPELVMHVGEPHQRRNIESGFSGTDVGRIF